MFTLSSPEILRDDALVVFSAETCASMCVSLYLDWINWFTERGVGRGMGALVDFYPQLNVFATPREPSTIFVVKAFHCRLHFV